jgi:hypothetical protein
MSQPRGGPVCADVEAIPRLANAIASIHRIARRLPRGRVEATPALAVRSRSMPLFGPVAFRTVYLWVVARISMNISECAGRSAQRDALPRTQPELFPRSGDAGTSSITRNTTPLGAPGRNRTSDTRFRKADAWRLRSTGSDGPRRLPTARRVTSGVRRSPHVYDLRLPPRAFRPRLRPRPV